MLFKIVEFVIFYFVVLVDGDNGADGYDGLGGGFGSYLGSGTEEVLF